MKSLKHLDLGIFVTENVTEHFIMALRTKIRLREYQLSDGTTPIYLSVSGFRQRERIGLNLSVDKKLFNLKTQRLCSTAPDAQTINLKIENIEATITGIKTEYFLSRRVLTPKKFVAEFNQGKSRTEFLAFFSVALEEEQVNLKPGTYRRHKAILKKLRRWKPEILFQDIDEVWFNSLRRHFKKLDNKDTTINSNISAIKKYLRMAIKSGAKITCSLEDVATGRTTGNRSFLNREELVRLMNHFVKGDMPPEDHLILAYFLFVTMTGLRISNLQMVTRKMIRDGEIQFVNQKNQRDQNIALNKVAMMICQRSPRLFVDHFSDKHLNERIKVIVRHPDVRIYKHVCMHVGRHTFATNYLKAGGKVENLKVLLGHRKIETTMIYVHVLANEANQDVHRLSDYLIASISSSTDQSPGEY